MNNETQLVAQAAAQTIFNKLKFGIFALFAFGAILVISLSFSVAELFSLRNIDKWPAVQAKVVNSYIKEITESSNSGPSQKYEIFKVAYRYEVLGKSYYSDRYKYFDDSWHKGADISKAEFKEKYKKGNIVTAYYNDQDHAVAVIVNSKDSISYTKPFLHLLFTVIILYIIFRIVRFIQYVKSRKGKV